MKAFILLFILRIYLYKTRNLNMRKKILKTFKRFPFKSRLLQSENDCKVMSVVVESMLV